MAVVIGIDLAGKDKNETGFCVLKEGKTSAKVLFSNEELLEEIEKEKPDLIAIDAPFDFPSEGFFRNSDDLLRKRGFTPLSPVFRGMQPLVERAKVLVKILKDKNYKVIEVFPKATEHILGLNKDEKANDHEYDSLLCALTGKAYLENKYENLDGIIIPK